MIHAIGTKQKFLVRKDLMDVKRNTMDKPSVKSSFTLILLVVVATSVLTSVVVVGTAFAVVFGGKLYPQSVGKPCDEKPSAHTSRSQSPDNIEVLFLGNPSTRADPGVFGNDSPLQSQGDILQRKKRGLVVPYGRFTFLNEDSQALQKDKRKRRSLFPIPAGGTTNKQAKQPGSSRAGSKVNGKKGYIYRKDG